MPQTTKTPNFAEGKSKGPTMTGKSWSAFSLTQEDHAALEYPLDTIHEATLKGIEIAFDYLCPILRQAEHDRDRYYRHAFNKTPLKKQGKTFEELCRERGEHDLADRVHADMEKLYSFEGQR
jgi:hypothetical protein